MDLGLSGRTVIVLGAGRGIGAACAREFSREGATVMLFGRDAARLRATASELVGPYGIVVGDLAVVADLKRLVESAVEKTGRIDVLFANGGGPTPGGFDELDDAAWQSAYEQTLLGYIRAIRLCLPHMRDAGWGRILTNTSSSVKVAIDSLILSNVFRLGVMGLVRSLATEVAAQGILVNAIAAGKVATDRSEAIDKAKADRLGMDFASVRRAAEASIPVGRYGTTEEFAKAAVFHCSDANSYITGQAILVDGGQYKGF